ncbi:MAG: HAD-IIA family hydrolase [Actinomycetota bacterium]|nr:HAD-IIA family hydrolase [Actinomycetota bacterium]
MTVSETKTVRSLLGTIVFDLDGVIYLGSSPIPGARSTIEILTRLGWTLLFATNDSEKTPETVASEFATRMDVAIDPSAIITSSMTTIWYLREHGLTSAYVVGSPRLQATLVAHGVAAADGEDLPRAVVVGLDRGITYEKIHRAARAIRSGAVFVATNTDATIPTSNGVAPGAGAIVAAIAEASAQKPVTCGKPSEAMLDVIRDKIEGPRVWMIGDRPETDIAFAKAAGWTSVLTLSGVTRRPSEVPPHLKPDHVIASVADLPGLLLNNGERTSLDEG